jgi:GDP-4-dehydro-6-deoxy-D-mannose reductase
VTARVVVTGATGLLGRAVFERLDDAFGVARTAPPGERWVSADLAVDASAVGALRPDAVVHLAGSALGDESELVRANVESTRQLLRALAGAGLRPYVIVAGSAAEYGEPPSDVVDEDSPVAPVTPYGRIKAAQTRVAREEAASAGIPLTVIRPFNVVSSELRASTALGSFRRQLLEQEGSPRTLRCGRLDIVRDYVTPGFVADAVARLLERDERPSVLNVCSGVGIELRAIVDEIAQVLGAELDIVEVPELVNLAAANRVVGDPRRLAGLGLTFRPTPASLARELLAQ